MFSMRDLIPWRGERTPTGGEMAGGRGELHPLLGLRHDIDRLFEEAWRGFDLPFAGAMSMPRVDVTEDEKSFRITAELPGMDESDVEVLLQDDRLVIRGEKKEEKREEKGEGYSYSERRYGRFERSFPVGANVNTGEIKAGFDKGVLSVVLPKTEESMKHYRKIPVEGRKKD